MGNAYLDADAIRASTFIRHVEIHDTIGSTNDRAAKLARNVEIELPALVAARHQTAGRGRGKNVWQSAEGALAFSILLNPATFGISSANWPQLSLTMAVAVCDAVLLELNPQSETRNPKSCPYLAIKWPNDILLDGGKLCGILLESPGGPVPAKDCLVIGIGVNVNNSWRTPQGAARGLARHNEKPRNASALCDVTGQSHNLQTLLCNTLRSIETRISQLGSNDSRLPLEWQRFCWLTDAAIEVTTNSETIDGTCLGIDVDGKLLIETIFETRRISSGSVRAVDF